MKYRIKQVTISGIHKVGTTVTYTFNQNDNYILGPNGSGKSTILQAIQWALLGYIPGTAKKPSAIWEHRHPTSYEMYVKLVLEELETSKCVPIVRTLRPDGSSWNNKVVIGPGTGLSIFDENSLKSALADIELPIFNFSSFLSMSQNQIKDWFLKYLPECKAKIDLRSVFNYSSYTDFIPSDQKMKNLINKFCKILDQSDDTVANLQEINRQIKSEISFTKGELARVVATLQSLVKYDVDETRDSESIKEELSKKRQELSTTNTHYQLTLDRISSANMLERFKLDNSEEISFDVDGAKIKMLALLGSIESATSDLEDCKSELSKIEADISFKQGVVQGGSTCPFTKIKCDKIDEFIHEVEEQIYALNERYDEVLSNKKVIQADLTRLQEQYDELLKSVKASESSRERLAFLESQVNPAFTEEMAESLKTKASTLEEEVAELEDILVKVTANEQYEQLFNRISEERFGLEQNLETFKEWEKITGTNGLQSEISKAPFEALTCMMNTLVSDMYGPSVRAQFLVEGKSNSFSFGLVVDGSYVPYNLLSSGEKCIYALILFTSLISSKDNLSLPIVLIDDMFDHLDANHLSRLKTVLNRLKDTSKFKEIQFIIAGVLNNSNTLSLQVLGGDQV